MTKNQKIGVTLTILATLACMTVAYLTMPVGSETVRVTGVVKARFEVAGEYQYTIDAGDGFRRGKAVNLFDDDGSKEFRPDISIGVIEYTEATAVPTALRNTILFILAMVGFCLTISFPLTEAR